MIWIAKFLYTALKWLILVPLITGITIGTWLKDGLVYIWLWCSVLSQGLLLYYTLHWLLENHTVLHCDVHLEWGCACLMHNWLQDRVELALSVPGRHVYVCVRGIGKSDFPLINLSWKIWQVLHWCVWLPQQPWSIFVLTDAYRICLDSLFRTPLNETNSVCAGSQWQQAKWCLCPQPGETCYPPSVSQICPSISSKLDMPGKPPEDSVQMASLADVWIQLASFDKKWVSF